MNTFTNFIRNEIVAPILGVLGGIFFIYLVAYYAEPLAKVLFK
ncbi:hypothetical protein [Halobacillus litoralis]|nr:hypothetical protein [Halobacillus litoralis]